MTLFLIPVIFGAIMVGGFGFLSPSKSFDYAFYLTISGVCVSFLTACLFKFVMSTQGKSQQPKPNSAHDYRSRSRSAYNDIYRPPPDHDISRPPTDHDRYRSPPDHDIFHLPTVHYDNSGVAFSPYASRY